MVAAGSRKPTSGTRGPAEEERIIRILPLSKDVIESPGELDLVFATKEGRVKRSRLEEYVRINRNGKYAIKLAAETDMLVGVRLLTKEDHVLLVTERAWPFASIRPQKERTDKDTGEVTVSDTVRVQGRINRGVAGIKLNDGDHGRAHRCGGPRDHHLDHHTQRHGQAKPPR